MSETQAFDLELVPGAVKAAMAGVKSSDLWKVPRDRIKVMPGFNVRLRNDEYAAQIRFIADSMLANGYFADKPIAGFVAREDGENVIYVVDGHTRLEAVDLANSEGAQIHEIPVVTKPAGTSMEDLTVALVVSNEGRNLSPYEIALVCKRLIGFGMEEAEVARRIGKTRAYVTNLLLLVAAPRAVTNLVQSGQVSATLAVETVKAHGKEAANVLKVGLKAAQDMGKDKVTGKHLPPKPVKVKADKQGDLIKALDTQPAQAGPAVNVILDKGLKWIRANDPNGAASILLLAYLAGVGVEVVEAGVCVQAEPVD